MAIATDRRTQWFEARPVMPASGEAYRRAFDANLSAMPMVRRRIHSDNGEEFINELIQEHVRSKWPRTRFSRSYPGRKNDNAHIEQKNGSVVRAWLGEIRDDRPEVLPLLWRLAKNISLHTHLFRPVQMLTGRTKREDGKGYAKTYDSYRTPAQRVLDSPDVPEAAKARIDWLLECTNGSTSMSSSSSRSPSSTGRRKRSGTRNRSGIPASRPFRPLPPSVSTI